MSSVAQAMAHGVAETQHMHPAPSALEQSGSGNSQHTSDESDSADSGQQGEGAGPYSDAAFQSLCAYGQAIAYQVHQAALAADAEPLAEQPDAGAPPFTRTTNL